MRSHVIVVFFSVDELPNDLFLSTRLLTGIDFVIGRSGILFGLGTGVDGVRGGGGGGGSGGGFGPRFGRRRVALAAGRTQRRLLRRPARGRAGAQLCARWRPRSQQPDGRSGRRSR